MALNCCVRVYVRGSAAHQISYAVPAHPEHAHLAYSRASKNRFSASVSAGAGPTVSRAPHHEYFTAINSVGTARPALGPSSMQTRTL